MNVHELIEALEDMPEDAEVRLAIQPNYPFQHAIGEVVLDGGHQHEWISTKGWGADGDPAWGCEDPDCDAEGYDAERPPRNDKTGDDSEDEGIVYIGEGGQVYEAPYLPASAAQELGWR